MARPQLNTVTLDFLGEVGANLVNIPKALSLLNRKSYRQGFVYSVDYIEFITDEQNQRVSVAKLPENYNTLAAYRLGWMAWRHQRAESIAETGIEPGKWSDFKPFFNQDHFDTTLPELNVKGMGGGYILQNLDQTGSEWNYAEIIRNDPGAATVTTINVGMLGDDDIPNSYGSLIDAWGDTRSATLSPDPLTPDVAESSWIIATGAESSHMGGAVIDLVDDENDKPPYANQADTALAPTYVGGGQSAPYGMMVDKSVSGNTGRAISLNGGLFPLGYLVVQTTAAEYTLRVHCTRGDYKGVAALSMGDFS